MRWGNTGTRERSPASPATSGSARGDRRLTRFGRIVLYLGAALSLVGGAPLLAQGATSGSEVELAGPDLGIFAPLTRPASTHVAPQDADGPGVWALQVRGGARFLSALGSSVAAELVVARDNGRGNTRGWVASGEYGEGGTGFFLGHRRGGNLWNAIALGAAYLRTDDGASGVAPSQSFLGPEFRLTLLGIGFSTAYYWRVDGSAPGDERLFDAALLLGWW